MKLVTVAEMRTIEKEANANGLVFGQMMDNAGCNLANRVMELAYSQKGEDEVQVLGLVGSGNNGGDTLVALCRLAEKGWTARAYLVGRKAEGDSLVKRLEEADGETYLADEDAGFHQLEAFIETADILLDGVAGTGFKLPMKAETGNVLSAAKAVLESMDWPPLVVAVDCPSGVDCDLGTCADETIPADATITMAAIKRGMLRLPAYEMIGEVSVVSIGEVGHLASWQALKNEVAEDAQIALTMPARPLDGHKGTFGTTVIAAGSINYTGAALLAGKAAGRSGTGLVTLAVPAILHTALAGHFLEGTWILLPHEMGGVSGAAAEVLMKHLKRATALLVGPGLGVEGQSGDFVEKLLSAKNASGAKNRKIGFVHDEVDIKNVGEEVGLPPLVVDADGLKLLGKMKNWPIRLPPACVLTPHPGEMAILTGKSVEEIQARRLETASEYARLWKQVVVLKGAFTVIAAEDGRTTTIASASTALAHAGTGDVLAGLIAGLRAQGMAAYEAAVAGAWIHARAGELAAEYMGSERPVLAGDVLDRIGEVLGEL